MPTLVDITASDNELYISASNADGSGSYELIHLKSGYNDPVQASFNLESILPSGSYNLTFIGVNWGGPYNFLVSVGGNSYGAGPASGPVGVSWTQTIQVTI